MFCRRNRVLVSLHFLLVVLILTSVAYYLWESGAGAEPVRLHLAGLSPEASERIQVIAIDPKEKTGPLEPVEKTGYWFCKEKWVSTLMIWLPAKELARLKQVILTIGDRDFIFSGKEARAWDASPSGYLLARGLLKPGEVAVLLPSTGYSSSWVPSLLNWPGDAPFLWIVAQKALLPVLVVLAWCVFSIQRQTAKGQQRLRQVLGFARSPWKDEVPDPGARAWNWVGNLFLVGALIFLEVREPFYFTQSDNLLGCLPVTLEGCRSIWQGDFPHYNPYTFLGSPLAGTGIYSLTYPPLHLSYGLARHLLGQEYATYEVFAVIHLLAGFLAMRLLARRLGMASVLTNLVGLSFVLSGSFLIMGRSWIQFVTVAFWLPVFFLGLLSLQRGPVGWRWALVMGLGVGLAYQVGFSQIWIYLVGYFCLGLLFAVATGILPWQRSLWVVPVLLLGTGMALPLLLQQWELAKEVMRTPANAGIGGQLAAFLLPYPLTQAVLPIGWGNAHLHYLGHFYFFGGLLAFGFLVQAAGVIFFRPPLKHGSDQFWTWCGLLTLWLALGRAGGLWTLVSQFPVLSLVNRNPMRLVPFVVFFACLSGGLLLHRLRPTGRIKIILALVGLALLGVHVYHCRTAFFLYPLETVPYPPLSPSQQALFWDKGQLTGRILSWDNADSGQIPHAVLLTFNVPAVHQLPTPKGQDPLFSGKPFLNNLGNTFAQWKAYGVRWHSYLHPDHWPGPSTTYSPTWMVDVKGKYYLLHHPGSPLKFPPRDEKDGIIISEQTPVDPLAFATNKPHVSLPLQAHGLGLDVNVSTVNKNQEVVVNFLHYPEMVAFLDGQALPCERDQWKRMVVHLPREGNLLTIRYRPAWEIGIISCLAVMGLALVVILILQKMKVA
jgi:hypothetical protein